jgi:hypothetical protein
MLDFAVLEPAVDPANRISFLLDWELTLKCNLDCDYCETGAYGGHDNSTKHPSLADCVQTIDFMFEYVDLYMSTKPQGIRYVILNVYGGEALNHPDIVEILKTVREKYLPYQDRWQLTVTTTTNAIVSKKILSQIVPLIDEFTVSYHTNNTARQKQQFKDNLLDIKAHGKRQKCIVLMHAEPELFEDSQGMIEWLTNNDIKYLPRQLDSKVEEFNYNDKQVVWFNKLYNDKSYNSVTNIVDSDKEKDDKINLTEVGRACCGGRQLCKDQNHKSRNFFVDNKFPDWYCSVNHFFVYIKQVTREIFVNKDCKMSFDGSVGPIGTLDHSKELLQTTREQLTNNILPVIQCKKGHCLCGLCAPKAQDLNTYNSIMKKYQTI